MNRTIKFILLATASSGALAQSSPAGPAAPEVEVCIALHSDVTANGNLISACAIDRDRNIITIEGGGLTKLDLAAMCAHTLSVLTSAVPVSLDLKGAGTQPSVHTICRTRTASAP